MASESCSLKAIAWEGIASSALLFLKSFAASRFFRLERRRNSFNQIQQLLNGSSLR